ncbi:MAG: signal peptidase I [Proteobacteria bacterium]|nr:signal peptidase I [Pseudomonadota bacterium]
MSSQTIEKKKQKAPWDESIRTVIIAFLLAIVFRSLVFEPFHIPSGSMKNTLLVGDYLFVSKYSYGYSRYSFPFGFRVFDGRVLETKPKRGDIVVFRLPSNPRIDFIKRIVGLPGDKIQVKNGVLHINGEPVKREKLPSETDIDERNVAHTIPAYAETLPEGKTIHTLKEQPDGQGPADDTQLYEVPQNHYFMMGDNRDNSRDSRYMNEVGFVPEENIVGRAALIFFSSDNTATLYNPLSWVMSLRSGRFFKLIE